jgi:FtsP/CotA-like multicopper oxidase with cupredoxin domain
MRLSASIVSRRHVLAGAGAAVTCFSLPFGTNALGTEEAASLAPDGFQLLHARATSVRQGPQGAPDGAAAAPIWSFEGAVPGPLLRIKRGEELRVRLVNELPGLTAIHWHGVRAPERMDGAPGLAQAAVAPGARFDYRFRPPDAGTFWYHAPWFAAAPEGAARPRLHGALIVEEAEPVEVDREHVLVFDDWPIGPQDNPQPAAARSFQIMANGTPLPDLAVRANERLRLRLVNAAQARVVAVRLDRQRATVMAIDGQPSEPFPARDNRVILGPGNTADLFVDATLEPGAAAPILWADARGETPLARLVYDPAPPVRSAPLAPPRPLPANPLPARLDLIHAVKLDLPVDDLARGTAAPPQQPPRLRVKRGRTVTLALANRKDFAYAVHVHGHAFRLLDRLDDGWKPFWLTTVLVDGKQTMRIAFLADNPGKWLIECVAIDHPETVAAGWFEVI